MDGICSLWTRFYMWPLSEKSNWVLFCQQSGTLEKQLLYVSFWCVLMVLISSGMLLAPSDSDVSATIAVRKHWWWIYNTQTSAYWPEKWLGVCFGSKTGLIHTNPMLPKLPYQYFNETFYPGYNSWLLLDDAFSMRHSWGSYWIYGKESTESLSSWSQVVKCQLNCMYNGFEMSHSVLRRSFSRQRGARALSGQWLFKDGCSSDLCLGPNEIHCCPHRYVGFRAAPIWNWVSAC